MATRSDLLQGTLDLIVLRILSLGPRHGYAIAQRINQISEESFQVNQGSLYPALLRLEQRGWVKSSWGTTDTGREAKFFELTRSGRKQLAVETENWERVKGAIGRLLEATE
ncbi:MAG: PadR family transcriptional regulator [Bryobacteraceae bacterium]|nr:PadR family transcriptional regulator [Bryobacteraceae bacterium]